MNLNLCLTACSCRGRPHVQVGIKEKDNIMHKTFKYEAIEQIPAEAASTSNASKFHNKEGEIHE